MDFLQGQETLTSFEWILRAIIAFFFLLIIAKLLGQRAISQLRVLDFAIALVIGNIMAHPLSDENLGMKGSVLTTTVLAALYLGGIYITLKWEWFRKLLTPAPITVVKKGEIIYKGIKKARISIDVLLAELREEKIEDVKKVALALWEADGKLSVFLEPEYQPLTPSSILMDTEPFYFPKTIIKEGKINDRQLKHLQKNEEWIASRLKILYQAEVKDVLFATLDSNDHLTVFLYK